MPNKASKQSNCDFPFTSSLEAVKERNCPTIVTTFLRSNPNHHFLALSEPYSSHITNSVSVPKVRNLPKYQDLLLEYTLKQSRINILGLPESPNPNHKKVYYSYTH